MRVFFLDGNAVARRYFEEIGSRVIRAIEAHVLDPAEDSYIAYSSLAIVEVESVLNQLAKQERFKAKLPQAVRDAIMKRVVQDGKDDLVIRHSSDLELRARQFIRKYDLYTLDALHLAAASEIHTTLAGNEQLTFVTSDEALLGAVSAMNIPNLTPLDFITCVCRACGSPFHPPIGMIAHTRKQIRCPHCNSLVRCRRCYDDITQCKNTWMPDFLQPYAP